MHKHASFVPRLSRLRPSLGTRLQTCYLQAYWSHPKAPSPLKETPACYSLFLHAQNCGFCTYFARMRKIILTKNIDSRGDFATIFLIDHIIYPQLAVKQLRQQIVLPQRPVCSHKNTYLPLYTAGTCSILNTIDLTTEMMHNKA